MNAVEAAKDLLSKIDALHSTAAVAAAAHADDVPEWACSLYKREITLTPSNRTDKKLGITLVGVDAQGAALISVKSTNEQLRAMPGEPFLGEQRHFGNRGLVLVRSDPTRQTALLERTSSGEADEE